MTERTRPVIVLLGCACIGASTNAFMIAPASIAPPLAADFAINRTDIGTVISAAVLGSVIAQLPSGILMDRYDNRRLMLGGAGIFAAACISVWLIKSYPVWLVSRFIGGMMIGLTFTTSAKVIGYVFPAAKRGTATSLFVASAPLGFAIAQLSSPIITEWAGWRTVFTIWAGVAVLGYLLFRISTPVPIRTGERLTTAEFIATIRNPAILLVATAAFCSHALYFFLNSWMPTYANEILAISLTGAGAVTALVPFVGIAARPGGGVVSDYLNNRRHVIAASLAFELPILLLIIQITSPLVFGILLLLAGFAAQFSTGIFYAYTQELAPPTATGTSLTVFTTLAFSGSLVAPVLGGWLIELFSWTITFWVFTAIAVIGALTVLAVPYARHPT